MSSKLLLFSYLLVLTYVLGTQKNRLIDRLIETVLLITHNICCDREKRKIIINYTLYLESCSVPCHKYANILRLTVWGCTFMLLFKIVSSRQCGV